MITAGLSEELERRITAVIKGAPINSSKSCFACDNDVMMTSSDIASLGPIKEQLPAEIDYWHIKMTISILQISTNYIKPGTTNKAPSNNSLYKKTVGYYSQSPQPKRQLPAWTAKKQPSKKSRKFI